MDRTTFAKLLQENEKRIYWQSAPAPEGCIIHEWRLIDNDKLLLREIQHAYGSEYFYFKK